MQARRQEEHRALLYCHLESKKPSTNSQQCPGPNKPYRELFGVKCVRPILHRQSLCIPFANNGPGPLMVTALTWWESRWAVNDTVKQVLTMMFRSGSPRKLSLNCIQSTSHHYDKILKTISTQEGKDLFGFTVSQVSWHNIQKRATHVQELGSRE